MKSYFIVFHGLGNPSTETYIKDISDDPCFDTPPSWGICRPPTRRSIDIGDFLFFCAYYKSTKEYFIKGYFKVGQKVSYDTALALYPSRLNVIISKTNNFSSRTVQWRYSQLKKQYQKSKGHTIQNWLFEINSPQGTFYQNNMDIHEIDNWKCRRIYQCDKNQFVNCTLHNTCFKNCISLTNYSDYIVAEPDNWIDLGYNWIDFKTFKQKTGFPKNIVTPKGQHNVLRCDDYTETFLEFFNTHKPPSHD